MVEKRQHPFVALFFNQLVYAIFSFFIVTTVSGRWQLFFGIFFLILYLFGVYGYAHRAGWDHQKSYSMVKPHIKFPLAYALIGICYVVVPLLLWLLFPYGIVYLLVTAWEGPFYFAHILYFDGVVNFIAAGIFSALIAVFSGFGYLAGVKGFHLITWVHQLLYHPVESDETKKEQ